MKHFTTAPDAKGKRVLLGLLAAVFWIAVWQAVSMAVGQELLVPAPLKVAGTLWRLLGSALFWKAAGFSLLRVRIPSVMPYFLTACTTGLGFAWKSGIAAEVICRPAASIGRQLQDAKTYLETPEVFAWTAVAVILSMALERLLVAAARRFGRRYNAQA